MPADRQAISDVLYRYASSIDSFNMQALRDVLADDLEAQWGNADPVHGGDAALAWISQMTETVVWQHHMLSVYHVDVDGDDATALVYHTSYQCFADAPNVPKRLVARYHNHLRRDSGGWRISKLVMELLWGETCHDDGYLEAVGGRGPIVWAGPGAR